jgi:hypothetical protein
MIWPSLCYPLPACTFTDSQGTKITRQLYKSLLPAMGTCQNFPLVYRHTPTSLQCLALPDPYIEKAISHIHLVLQRSTIDSPTGSLLHASLKQTQLKIGISAPFLSTPYETYGYLLTDCLWASIWEFISAHNIALSCTDQVLPTCQCLRDDFIMECLLQLETLSHTDLLSCNCCHLAIEAITMADIATGDGYHMRQDFTGANPSTTQ